MHCGAILPWIGMQAITAFRLVQILQSVRILQKNSLINWNILQTYGKQNKCQCFISGRQHKWRATSQLGRMLHRGGIHKCWRGWLARALWHLKVKLIPINIARVWRPLSWTGLNGISSLAPSGCRKKENEQVAIWTTTTNIKHANSLYMQQKLSMHNFFQEQNTTACKQPPSKIWPIRANAPDSKTDSWSKPTSLEETVTMREENRVKPPVDADAIGWEESKTHADKELNRLRFEQPQEKRRNTASGKVCFWETGNDAERTKWNKIWAAMHKNAEIKLQESLLPRYR